MNRHKIFHEYDPTLDFALDWYRQHLGDVDQALVTIKRALTALGSKDRPEARAYLEGQRDTLAAGRAAFVSIGFDYDGPAAREMAVRYDAAYHAHDAADAALKSAPADRAAITERRIDLDLALAQLHEVVRDVAALKASCSTPVLPDLTAIDEARELAQRVIALAKNRPAQALEVALELGSRVDRAKGNRFASAAQLARERLVQLLVECWATDAEPFVWMRRRIAESVTPEEAAAVAAE